MTELMYQVSTGSRQKRVLRIPESHILYASPDACARRRGIRALKNDLGDHLSFLNLAEADVATGAYEAEILDAVQVILDEMKPAPKAIMLYVNCIDDFVGTDFDALLAPLEAAYPEVRFLLARINPISEDVRHGKVQKIQKGHYALLEPAPLHDAGITLVGNFEPIPSTCEFWEIARLLGVASFRQLITCDTFDQYRELAKSSLCVSLAFLGTASRMDFADRLGIPGMDWHSTWDVDRIALQYQRFSEALGQAGIAPVNAEQAADLQKRCHHEACTALEAARQAVGDRPIVVDTSSSLVPHVLALALLCHGFNVAGVIALHAKGNDGWAKEEILRDYPQVAFCTRTADMEEFKTATGLAVFTPENAPIAIGVDARYFLQTPLFVDMYHDEGFWGYQGVCDLMEALRKVVA